MVDRSLFHRASENPKVLLRKEWRCTVLRSLLVVEFFCLLYFALNPLSRTWQYSVTSQNRISLSFLIYSGYLLDASRTLNHVTLAPESPSHFLKSHGHFIMEICWPTNSHFNPVGQRTEAKPSPRLANTINGRRIPMNLTALSKVSQTTAVDIDIKIVFAEAIML